MNILEFTSFVGDECTFMAPKDSTTVEVTLTTPSGRPVPVTNVSVAPIVAGYEDLGERWKVDLPAWPADGITYDTDGKSVPAQWLLLFDQEGVDTTYRIFVRPREER